MDLVEHGLKRKLQKLPGRPSVSHCNELSGGELGRSINAHEEIELPFSFLHLGDIDVEEPDGVALELLALGLVALDIRKTGDAAPLQAPMQRRPGYMQDRGLQGIQTIVQRQKRMTTKRLLLLLFNQNCLPRLLRPGLHILNSNSLPPHRHRLWVDAQFFVQFRARSLRSLYCSSDGVRGRGAPVTNLSHSETFHSRESIAPSNRGIKHLHGTIDQRFKLYNITFVCRNTDGNIGEGKFT